jgi:hypothetical protein
MGTNPLSNNIPPPYDALGNALVDAKTYRVVLREQGVVRWDMVAIFRNYGKYGWWHFQPVRWNVMPDIDVVREHPSWPVTCGPAVEVSNVGPTE